MAKDSTVTGSTEQINTTIQNAAASTSADMQDLNNSITGAISALEDGIKLTATSKEEEKLGPKEEPITLEGLRAQLEGLRVMAPELGEMAEALIGINLSTEASAQIAGESLEQETAELAAAAAEDTETVATFDTTTRDVSKLNGLVTLEEITGTGFSILGNIMQDLYSLFSSVLEGVAAGQLAAALLANNANVTVQETQKAASSSTAGESRGGSFKGLLAGFFQGIAGPLESVAGSFMVLSLAMSVLSLIQIDAQLIGSMILLGTFMLTTFSILARISAKYQENPGLLDAEGSTPGSLTAIINNFTEMVKVTAGALILSAVMVEFITDNWTKVLTGLAIIFGTALVTMIALSATSSLINLLIQGEETPINQTIKAFTTLVWTVAGLAIVCGLLEPIIMQGLTTAGIIFASVMVMMLAVTTMVSSIKVSGEQLQAFNALLKSITVLVTLVSILVIVLGIIPTAIIIQGMVSMGLIMGLIMGTMLVLGQLISKLNEIDLTKLQVLMGLIISITALIAVISILVVVLGAIEVSQLVQGLIAITLIMALPFAMIKLMAKLAGQAGQLPQALLGVAIAGIISIAVSAVAWVVISMFSGFEMMQVLTAVTAVSLTTLLLLGVGLASTALAAMAIPLATAFPLAMMGIGLTSVLAIAIAGIAALLATIMSLEMAQRAITVSIAISMTALTLVAIGATVMVLAAMALVIAPLAALALITVTVLQNFLISFAVITVSMIASVTAVLANLNLEAFNSILISITGVIQQIVALGTAIAAFVAVGFFIAVALSAATLLITSINVSMVALAIGLRLLNATTNLLPADLNFEPLVLAVQNLSTFSNIVNTFNAPDPAKMLALTFTLGYVRSFAKKLAGIGSDEEINKINTLAMSLSNLAQNATSMGSLAVALREVAAATKELNEVNEASKFSAEKLSGQAAVNAIMSVTELKKPKEEAPADSSAAISEQLGVAINTLQDILSNMQQLRTSTTKIADVQYSRSIAPRTSYM